MSTGYYGTTRGMNVPCLVYSTFSNRIFIYHNIKLPSIASTNLITAMQSKVHITIVILEQAQLLASYPDSRGRGKENLVPIACTCA